MKSIYYYTVEFNIFAPCGVGWLPDRSYHTYEEAVSAIMQAGKHYHMNIASRGPVERGKQKFWATGNCHNSRYNMFEPVDIHPAAIIYLFS